MADEQAHVSVTRDEWDVRSRAAVLLDGLLRDPRTARDAEKLVKTINPEAKFPTTELAEGYIAPVREELEATRKELAEVREGWQKDRDERVQKETVAAFTTRLGDAQKKYGFDEDTMQKVMKRMQEQNSPDVEGAAAYVYDSLPKPPPANARTTDNYLPGKVDLYGSVSRDKAFEDLHQNPDRYFDETVREIMRDPSLAQ